MKIALGADHAGFQLKEKLRSMLRSKGVEVVDFGTDSGESTDYPDYALKVSRAVASGRADRGVLVCFTGIGMSIAANKVPGIRAAVAINEDAVRLTRAHNDANVLTLAAKYTSESDAERYVDAFLATAFEGGRHARRVGKIAEMEHESVSQKNQRGGTD
jgi:ribose 5-phosphate isomerase B